MAHDCPFDGDHSPLELDLDVKQAMDGGFCPLCLHDFAAGETCIECGHAFEVGTDGSVKVIPLED